MDWRRACVVSPKKDDGFRCFQASKLLPRGNDPQTACLSIAVFPWHPAVMVAGGWIYARCMYFGGVVLFPLLLLFIFLFFSFLFPNPAREWRKRLDEQGSMEMQPMLLCSRLFREYKTPYCTMQYSILPYDSALKKTSLFFFLFYFIFLQKPALGWGDRRGCG